jgi:hypothetical protein
LCLKPKGRSVIPPRCPPIRSSSAAFNQHPCIPHHLPPARANRPSRSYVYENNKPHCASRLMIDHSCTCLALSCTSFSPKQVTQVYSLHTHSQPLWQQLTLSCSCLSRFPPQCPPSPLPIPTASIASPSNAPSPSKKDVSQSSSHLRVDEGAQRKVNNMHRCVPDRAARTVNLFCTLVQLDIFSLTPRHRS